jgi:hypothetical protein
MLHERPRALGRATQGGSMANVSIRKPDIPLWSGGTGSLAIDVGALSPEAPLVPTSGVLFNAGFQVEGGHEAALGASGALSLGVKADTSVTLAPLWRGVADDGLVEQYGLGPALQEENLILALRLGAAAEATAAATFRYGVLSAGASLDAGAHAGFVATRVYPRSLALRPMLADFFARLRLPCDVDAPLAPGEVVALEYDGYLKLGATVGAGYEVKGTHSLEISQLKLAEHYGLSVVGQLSVGASLAGSFAVELRAAEDPRCVRVSVRRRRASELRVAADVGVDATLVSEGLPSSGKEFLGALLGVQAKSWLNLLDSVVDEAGAIGSLDDLKAKLDGLAGDFVSKWLGKAIDQVTSVPEVEAALGRVKSVVDSYRGLDNAAITLFDRFYDPVTATVGQLEAHLQRLFDEVTSWDLLPGDVEPELWRVVRQLTDGDPLAWLLGKVTLPGRGEVDSLQEFRRRIQDTLALVRDQAHAEIRRVIALAKEHFPLDRFLEQLDGLDTPEKLTAAASTEVGHFVSRLVGRAVDATLSEQELEAIVKTVKKIADAKERFWETFDRRLQDVARQTLSLRLQAEYARADERQALVELDVRLRNDDGSLCAAGLGHLKALGCGDFAGALGEREPGVVRLRSGLLTHSLSSRSAVTVNIVGWHLDFRYQNVQSLLIDSRQQIEATDQGLINVFTQVELKSSVERRRGAETMQANFVLRFLGETHDAVAAKFDARHTQYLVDVITGQAARYDLTLVDDDTTPAELREYLGFAREMGLDAVGATEAGLRPLLELKAGSYGPLEASFDVRYTEAGLRALFAGPVAPDEAERVRQALRRILLGSYVRKDALRAAIAWAYATPGVFASWADLGSPAFVGSAGASPRAFGPLASPVAELTPPASVTLNRTQRSLLAQLFAIQEDLVKAFEALRAVLGAGRPLALDQFEKKLAAFGKALQRFDGVDMRDNTLFAVFDELVRLHTPGAQARASSLTLKARVQGAERTFVFLLQPPG